MALHSLSYCERLYYLEEVEELRVADDRVYAGRELHESLAASESEQGNVETLHLASERLGLQGKVDAVKRRDGSWIPYEHKRGRCKRTGSANLPVGAEAWETDAQQVAAYAMLLEEHLGREVLEGRVRYHADNVTVRVPIDASRRERVRAAVDRAGKLAASLNRPPVTDNENLCRRCSLAPVCLPDEARLAADPTRAVKPTAPAKDLRTALHVVSAGATVSRSGLTLMVTPRKGEGNPSRHPCRGISSVLLHGHTQITTQALMLCAEEEIAVHWLSVGGRHGGSLTTTAGQVQRRLRQYEALTNDRLRLRLAKALVRARVEGQHRYLLRATRGAASRSVEIRHALDSIARHLKLVEGCGSVDALRGHEGSAAKEYWSCFNELLGDSVTAELRYSKRTRRPPTDRLSSVLNFGYALLQTAVMRSILATGLEPAFGFYHTPRSAAHPLVLDLMEPFRVILWDMPLVASLNRGQWDPITDFEVATRRGSAAAVWLSDSGRKKAIGIFERRLAETWKHPVVGHTLSYSRTLELEARLLEKEWSDEPGLFAKLRLR